MPDKIQSNPSLLDEVLLKVESPAIDPKPVRKPARTRKEKPYNVLKTQAKAAADRKAEKKAAKASKGNGKPIAKSTSKSVSNPTPKKGSSASSNGSKSSARCSVCGKLLSRHSSVINGMGETCARQLSKLPKGVSLEQHYETVTVQEAPGKEYLKLREAIEVAKKKGVSLYAFLQAAGGNRMLRPPLTENFKVVFYKNTRYIPKASTSDKELKPLKK